MTTTVSTLKRFWACSAGLIARARRILTIVAVGGCESCFCATRGTQNDAVEVGQRLGH